jgi:lipopolysaccharide/colanic/teichoic acid biosynthesis glycosyltransferase
MQTLIIRILDILISIFAILLGMPLILAIFVIGYLANRSPLFFQQRVGKSLLPFTLVKFRTMSPGTQSVGTHLVDSTSVTKLGHFLRKTKLDELPQLFNVLLGNMSLVGPRPCLPNQLELIAERDKRGVYTVRPGITGLAQIYDVDMSTPKKLARYDSVMIKNLNLRLYLRLLVATVLGRGSGDRIRNK